jgi:putative ABC transport system permease protein
MLSIALRMLFGDPVKLLGLVAGIAFSTLLMAQQGGFFDGLISRSSNGVTAISSADVWIMDQQTETAESPVALRPIDLYRVRGVPGVETAQSLLQATVTLRTADGRSTAATLYGLDSTRMTGLPDTFVQGSPAALSLPDSVAVDILSANRLWPEGVDLAAGAAPTLEINDRRAVVTAVTDTLPGFGAPGVLHARAVNAVNWAPDARPSFILVTTREDPRILAERITGATGLKALAAEDFARATVGYVIANTGIAFSFGVVIGLRVIVGILVSGLTFTLFVNDNIRQFSVLKAVGVSNLRLLGMVSSQALAVAFLGYAFGLWAAAGFFDGVNQPESDLKGFYLPWEIAVGVGGATVAIVLMATMVSLRRVLRLDPATIFRG